MEMYICPICKGILELNKLLAPALDVYSSELYAYARCSKCSILVLQNHSNPENVVDYSESGYYKKTKIKWSGFLEKIITAYTAYRISITRNATDDNSLNSKRILDIGCGKGRFLLRAQELGAEVRGVEPTRRSYEEARCKLNGAVQNTIMTNNLFEADFFDVVTMWHVFEHISDPISMLDVCHNILKSGGRLIVAVPNYSGFISTLGGAVWFNLDPPRHLVHYNTSSLTALLNQTGFEVVGVTHYFPELTYLSAIQTILNKLMITNNFLFNYLKRNVAGLPKRSVIYYKDLTMTVVLGLLLAPIIFFLVPLLSLFGKSDCITLIARKR